MKTLRDRLAERTEASELAIKQQREQADREKKLLHGLAEEIVTLTDGEHTPSIVRDTLTITNSNNLTLAIKISSPSAFKDPTFTMETGAGMHDGLPVDTVLDAILDHLDLGPG